MSSFPIITKIIDGVSTTGVGTPAYVWGKKNIQVAIIGTGSANATIKCQTSVVGANLTDGITTESAPAFGSAQSVTNIWDYTAMYDYQDPSSVIPGDTGISFSGSADVRQFIVNVDGVKWLNFNITARSAGTFYVVAMLASNE